MFSSGKSDNIRSCNNEQISKPLIPTLEEVVSDHVLSQKQGKKACFYEMMR